MALLIIPAAGAVLGGVAVALALGVPVLELTAAIGSITAWVVGFMAVLVWLQRWAPSARAVLPQRPVVSSLDSTDVVSSEIVPLERSA